MLEEMLQNIGLSHKEAILYLATLRTGQAPISTIAKRVNMSRSSTYNILQRLFKKGIMRRIDRAKVQYFAPLPPAEIKDLLMRQKEECAHKIEMLETYLPQLQAISNPAHELPKVTFYEGVEGIKQIYQDILKKGNKETFAALSLDNIVPELSSWIRSVFTDKKVKKNIFSKVLISSKNAHAYKKLDKVHKRQSLTIPHEKFPFQVEIDLYDGNKTAFISFDEAELLGVIIESPRIARTLRALFELVWEGKKF